MPPPGSAKCRTKIVLGLEKVAACFRHGQKNHSTGMYCSADLFRCVYSAFIMAIHLCQKKKSSTVSFRLTLVQ